jgi:diadenosine tetraphosphate (Ap4A) HIT family hydrolase
VTDCLFCQKLLKHAQLPDDELVWQFPHSVAQLGPWQYYHGYCILIARRHACELSQLPPPERQAYVEEMMTLARALETGFQPRKLNYELLGNQVPHLHWHLFPRYAHDLERLKPVWLALDRAERDEAEQTRLQTGPLSRPATTQIIREQLRQLVARS